MSRMWKWALAASVLAALSAVALAEPPKPAGGPEETPGKGAVVRTSNPAVGMLGAALGAGVIVIGGGVGIGMIGGRVTDAIARQPEAANAMFMPWLLTAAMVEGATLFGLLICFLIAQAAGKAL